MNYNFITTKTFDKGLKALCKKYPSMKEDLTALKKELLETPTLGTHLGNNVYKIGWP
jgi:hypothetical protein